MSEADRRRKYVRNRVLIETARILSPTFHDAVVFLSGAQIELLRNVTQYLNRQETYVSEYNPGYYLTPTTADYDDLLEVVADLEETLMGNPNTIWGYADRWNDHEVGTSVGAGWTDADLDPVPAGYVYILEHWAILQAGDGNHAVVLQIMNGLGNSWLFQAPNFNPSTYEFQLSNITLKEGDYLQFRCWGLEDTKTMTLTVWGHMMIVPE